MLLNCGESICIFALTELSYQAHFETLICVVIEFISIQKSIVNNIGSRIRLLQGIEKTAVTGKLMS